MDSKAEIPAVGSCPKGRSRVLPPLSVPRQDALHGGCLALPKHPLGPIKAGVAAHYPHNKIPKFQPWKAALYGRSRGRPPPPACQPAPHAGPHSAPRTHCTVEVFLYQAVPWGQPNFLPYSDAPCGHSLGCPPALGPPRHPRSAPTKLARWFLCFKAVPWSCSGPPVCPPSC